MIHLINYATHDFGWSQYLSSITAKILGKVDQITQYHTKDIDEVFRKESEEILSEKRGAGYWLWKPYFIFHHLQRINDGEWLVYLDSGSIIYNDIRPVVDKLGEFNQDVFGFELPLLEKQWTKRELYLEFGLDPKADETNQIMATIIVIRKSNQSLKFVQDYLHLCSNSILINDSLTIPQDPDFIEHRHDQSIFSLLYKRNKFHPIEDLSQRSKFSKTYILKDYERVKLKDEKYHLSDGRYFRKNTINKVSKKPVIFMHKSRKPLTYFLKYLLKGLFGFLDKYKL